jgi:hypothetical protein
MDQREAAALAKLEKAIDDVVAKYRADQKVIFSSEAQRRRVQYESISKKLRAWNKRRKCIFDGCTSRSVRRSHSIQKAGPLSAIAEDSKVVTTGTDAETGEIILVEKGLSEASVYQPLALGNEKPRRNKSDPCGDFSG